MWDVRDEGCEDRLENVAKWTKAVEYLKLATFISPWRPFSNQRSTFSKSLSNEYLVWDS